MARRLFLVKLDEAVEPPEEEDLDLEAYYDSRAFTAVEDDGYFIKEDDTEYVRTLLSLTVAAVNTIATDKEIIAYALGESGNDILEVIRGIGEAATSPHAVTVYEVTE